MNTYTSPILTVQYDNLAIILFVKNLEHQYNTVSSYLTRYYLLDFNELVSTLPSLYANGFFLSLHDQTMEVVPSSVESAPSCGLCRSCSPLETGWCSVAVSVQTPPL